MSVEKLTKMEYTNSRMELEFFMYLPSVLEVGKSGTGQTQVNPSLFLRCRKNSKISEEYDYAKAAYKITPRNLYDVIKFFNVTINWFYDDKYNDLFVRDEEGKLIFNADYNKLSVSTPRGMYDTCVMQAVPTVIRFGDQAYEGIHLYINTSTYCIPLTFQELGVVFEILRHFSFYEEMTFLLTTYQWALSNGRITTRQEMTGPTPFD